MKIEEKIWSNYDELADVASIQGRWLLAEKMYAAAIEEAERTEKSGERLGKSCAGLARVYHKRRQVKLAMHFYQRAADIYQRNPDDHACALAMVLNNLAGLYIAENSLAKARTLLRKVLSIYEELLGENNPILVSPLVRLAYIYGCWKRFDKALSLYKRVRTIRGEVAIAEYRLAGQSTI
jgi:Flp pilus assembly protein TadD